MLPRIYRLPLARNVKFEGRRQGSNFFDCVVKSKEEKRPRFAVVIPSRVVKKAVARNRTRRLIFKGFENLLDEIDNVDLLVIVKKDLSQFKSQEVTTFLKNTLTRAQVLK